MRLSSRPWIWRCPRGVVRVTTLFFSISCSAAFWLPAAFAEDRSVDGTGNNIASPLLGSAGTDYLREASGAHYADGISQPIIVGVPSARLVSNIMMTQGETSVLDSRNLTAMVYTWGQFIDHDLDLRASAFPGTAFNIAVPLGDPSFDPANTGTQAIPMTRSAIDPATGLSAANPAQQINTVTSFIDGSMVYGSDATRAAWLRTGTAGQLKSTANPLGALLPYNDGTQIMDGLTGPSNSTSLFVAGDSRANEQIGITTMQTLLMREHNRQATLLARTNPTWTDEQIYQMARKITSGEIAAITYNEFLPALLGTATLGAYQGYNANVNPAVGNAFATVAFRVGHSMLDDDIERVGANGQTLPQGNLALRQAFFNPAVVAATGIDPMLRGFTTRVEQSVDLLMVDDIRNFLFGPPGAGGLDLAAIDIQRARDHGLADYNTMRADFGLPKVTSFAQITGNAAVQAQLQSLYGNVNNIDAFVGALAEDHLSGSSLGPLAAAVIADQFNRSRSGDRLFYMNDSALSPAQITSISSFSFAELIRRNSFVRNIQNNAFIQGSVTLGSSWNVAGGGSWSSAANWTSPAQAPTGPGVNANFISSPTSSSVVSLDGPVTIGSLVLSNSNNISLTPGAGGSLILDNLGANAGILLTGGAHSISANVNLVDSFTALYYAAGSFAISGNISETNAGRGITIDGSSIGATGGGATTLSGTNTYTGGVQVTQSLLNLNSNQAQGALGSVAAASNNGEIVLGFNPTAAHRFSLGDLGAIQGSSVQLGALSTASNLSLATGAVIIRQTAGGALPTGLPNSAAYYTGYAAGASVTGVNASVTVGSTSGTPFKGIAADRSGNYTWGTAADTLTLAGNADLVSLGASTLTLAAKVTGGLAANVITKRGTGTVALTNVNNNYAAQNLIVESGVLQLNYGVAQTIPATSNINIQSAGTLQFSDGFSVIVNGTLVNNGALVKPAGTTVQVAFKGPAVTGSGMLLSQDSQPNNSGPPNFISPSTAQVQAHAFLFDNGQVNTIGGLGGFDPNNSSPILALNGPNTVVHLTGRWQGDGSNQTSWVVLTNGAKVVVDSTAQLDTISDTGALRSFNGRGDGTGTFEFSDGFVANQHDTAPGVVEFYVWSPGNFRWITHSSTNFPDSNIEVNQEDGGTWSVQTRPQTLVGGFTTQKSITIETQADLTLAKDAAIHSFDGTKTITKTGNATLTVAGDWSIASGLNSRTQDTSLGTTFQLNAGKFVTMTDMGQAAISPGANAVFGPPGRPDADDVVSTKFIYNVNVNGAGTTADFNASQHLKSLKINSGGQANLNTFTYGNGTATNLQTDLLGADLGTGTLNVLPGNSATVRSGTGTFSIAPGASLILQGGGVLNVQGTQSHGAGASLNVASGTANLSTDAGANLSISTTGAVNFSVSQHLASLSVGSGGNATLASGGAKVLVVNSLAVNGLGTLNLSDNDLIINATAATRSALLASTTASIQSALNVGQWNGFGVRSSFAAADTKHLSALGILLNDNGQGSPLYTTFDGQPVNVNSILVKYTYYGDANLDGIVNGADYALVDNGFNMGLHGWGAGDFNYDGFINAADYALLDNTFNFQGAPLAVPTIVALVPEPSTIFLAAGGLAFFNVGLIGRRAQSRRVS